MMGGPHEKEASTLIAQLDQIVNPAPEEAEIWPDMQQAVAVFGAMSSQWNVGPGGAVGLRYEALNVVMDIYGIEPAQRRDLLADRQIMESAALAELRNG